MSTQPNYLKIAGNIHLSYYLEAADELGISYEVIVPALMARFQSEGKHWFILNTVLPVNNTPSSTISKRKNLTYKVLSDAGIPVAVQKEVFSEEEAVQFYRQYGESVFKPVQNLGGKGVSLLPRNDDEVRSSFRKAKELNLSKTKADVLAEEFVPGINYRLLVVGEDVVGVVKRHPAKVIGNGLHTISQLIEDANEKRKSRLMMPIPIDDECWKYLEYNSLSLDHIPAQSEEVYLRFNANLSTGGTTEEFSAQTHPYYRELAISATRAIGLKVGGVDLIAEDISNPDARHVINEVNYNPGLRLHYKVDKGDLVRVAVPVMRYIREMV